MNKFLIKSKKQMLLVIGVFTLVLMLGTTTYAFFNYTRTGAANTIRVGRISFVTRQTKTISLNNLFPIDPTDTEAMADTTKVGTVEIEIEGDTDYAQGVEYLVSSENTHITTSTGKLVPISLSIEAENLGTANTNYFTAREDKNATIYKKLVGNELVGDGMLLVGYIKPNTTSGTAEGIQNGKLTIKAYLDENKILISDTYDGTESDNMGTPNSMARGKTVLTTTEWNALQSSGVSFQIKVEANEGIWVNNTLDNIIRTKNLNTTTNQPIMDNVASENVTASTGINFGDVSSSTNGQGVYMRAGTENDAYPILYYRGAVEDNNVVFNNKCWKAVRTTDTGGVKLIYNGEPSLLKGPLAENDYNVVTNVGGFEYNSNDSTYTATITSGSSQEFSFTVPAGNNYTFSFEGYTGDAGGSVFLYKGSSYVLGTYGNGGGPNSTVLYSHDEVTLTSSDVMKFSMSFSGATPENPAILKIKVLVPNETMGYGCNNSGTNSQITLSGTNKFSFSGNNLDKSPAYNGYMWGEVYEWTNEATTSGAYYGTGFTWDGTNYKLTDAKVGYDGTHHYTCNSTTRDGTCSSIRYYYYVRGTSYNNYITLTGGDSIEKAIEKMQTNTNNSNAKTQIDTWYASNMNTVTSKLEDTIWCNDRSMGNGNNNGWIANGGDLNRYLYYGAYQRSNRASNTSTVRNRPSLACPNINDAFTVSNGNGNQKLTYPVALLTEDEMVLAGGLAGSSSTFYLASEVRYWSLSPGTFSNISGTEFDVDRGYISSDGVDFLGAGLRPSVSLKPGTPVIRGDGTVTSPYVIG